MRLDWKVLSSSWACFLVLAYVLCVAFDLLFDSHMYRSWMDLLPGFRWISWGSFLIGLVGTIAYGVFIGVVFAPIHNFFLVKVWKHAP